MGLIFSCTWNGRDCTISNDFKAIFTGIGVCYTYNREKRVATEPGQNSGLSLVLNVEQYEYMRGPQNDAGIKVNCTRQQDDTHSCLRFSQTNRDPHNARSSQVLLHDPDDRPEMTDQGFVVAPGTHTLVSVLQKRVSSRARARQPYFCCFDSHRGCNFKRL